MLMSIVLIVIGVVLTGALVILFYRRSIGNTANVDRMFVSVLIFLTEQWDAIRRSFAHTLNQIPVFIGWMFKKTGGQVFTLCLAGGIRYFYGLYQLEAFYGRSSGEDQHFIAMLLDTFYNSNLAPIVIVTLLAIFILPRQHLTRDKLVRFFYRTGFFRGYRHALQSVKILAWFTILSVILYLGMR